MFDRIMKRAASLAKASLLLRSAVLPYFHVFLWLILVGTCTFANAQSKVIYLSPTANSQTKP